MQAGDAQVNSKGTLWRFQPFRHAALNESPRSLDLWHWHCRIVLSRIVWYYSPRGESDRLYGMRGVGEGAESEYHRGMAQVDEHVAELLALPVEQRAKVARVLLDSLDEQEADSGAEEAQAAELVRRMNALDDGTVELIDGAEARARVMARLSSIRRQ
jgi:putative addiction module component (TIGR02574 family)